MIFLPASSDWKSKNISINTEHDDEGSVVSTHKVSAREGQRGHMIFGVGGIFCVFSKFSIEFKYAVLVQCCQGVLVYPVYCSRATSGPSLLRQLTSYKDIL